jgi:hypothetical protein
MCEALSCLKITPAILSQQIELFTCPSESVQVQSNIEPLSLETNKTPQAVLWLAGFFAESL